MSVDARPSFVPNCDSPHVVAILLRVSAQAYAKAARELKDGNLKASPLATALLESGTYILADYSAERITLRDLCSWKAYVGAMPALLAEYLAGFERGVRVLEDYEFELIIVGEEA